MNKTLISVITVCLNSEADIERTIRSVLDQDGVDFEYLVKDGQSLDSTVRIAENYRNRFKKKSITYRIISQRDSGLYDAMNQAAGFASGEWIIYINAGDALYDNSVLSRLSSEISEGVDVVYGDAVQLDNDKYKLLKAKGIETIKYINPICHQAALTRTTIVKKYRFDLKYPIAADFDLFLRLYLSNENSFKKLNFPVCIFRLGGISSSRVFQREREFNTSRKINGLKRVPFPHLQILKIVLIDTIRKMAIKIMGSGFYSDRRGWYSDKEKALAREK